VTNWYIFFFIAVIICWYNYFGVLFCINVALSYLYNNIWILPLLHFSYWL